MVKIKQLPIRQRIRKALLLISFLLFPLTLYYFSPWLIIQSASEGIVNGSLLVFGLMFLVALFLGRFWCGWICPAGAMQEFGASINNKPARGGKFDWIKWGIWIPWIIIIAIMVMQAGGYRAVNPFYQLEGGVTVLQDFWFIIYYVVIAVFLVIAIVAGRRAGCHYICWMAPFMIIGRRIRNVFKWPALCLQTEVDKCTHCHTCTQNCPMSLDVNQMVQNRDVENDECILCGTCVDNCKSGVIQYAWLREQAPQSELEPQSQLAG